MCFRRTWDHHLLSYSRGGALVDGLQGRVIEIGGGNRRMFAHYPAEVIEVVAVEPEPRLRAAAIAAARPAPVRSGWLTAWARRCRAETVSSTRRW